MRHHKGDIRLESMECCGHLDAEQSYVIDCPYAAIRQKETKNMTDQCSSCHLVEFEHTLSRTVSCFIPLLLSNYCCDLHRFDIE